MRFAWKKVVPLLGLLGLGLVAVADDSHDPDVLVAQNQAYGQYLTDYKGRPLYMFTRDTKDTSTCYDQCALNWPPLVFQDKSEPIAGKGLNDKLIGFSKRKDGKAQITYGGWPLYTYAKDVKAGEINGQGVGGNWFLLSPKGEIIKQVAQAPQTQQTQAQPTQPAQPAQPAQADAIAKLKAEGEPLYGRYCVGCHGVAGAGGVGPKLAGAPSILKDPKAVISQVLGGGAQMPGFSTAMNDKEVAALITFVRNSWGNAFGLTTEEEVKARR